MSAADDAKRDGIDGTIGISCPGAVGHPGADGINEGPPQITERPALPPASTPSRHSVLKDLIEALRPFGEYAYENDLDARDDDDVIEVSVRDVKRAATVYARVIGAAS